jgi:hypothetical protein
VTDARIEQVHADRITALEFLDQASDFLNDARVDGLGPASRIVLLHNAAIAACDAILQAVGLRITRGDRSHILRLETALHELGVDTDELLGRLDASRERRNEASYGGSFIAQASVRDAEEATTELLDLARAFIGASDAAAGCTLPTELLPAAPYRRGSPL